MNWLFAASGSTPHGGSYDVPIFMYGLIAAALVLYAIIEAVHGRDNHVIGFRSAVKWSAFYISLALLFTLPIYFFIGQQAAAEYVAAWAVEKMLSLDNLFIFGLIFTAFKVEQKYRRRILNYGIAGAILFRLLFIIAGLELLKQFSWVSIIFGAVLLHASYHAFMQARGGEHQDTSDILNSRTWRIMNKILPIHHKFVGNKLMTVVNGKRMLTMMAAVIILIELTDILFAVDSVPAVLAVTNDTYIAYASNVFAILGLRSLFFVYDSVADRFWALNWALSAILFWIGSKMVAAPLGVHPPIALNLSILFSLLFIGVVTSLKFENPAHKQKKS
jgi:tellurite resistance protein TerC